MNARKFKRKLTTQQHIMTPRETLRHVYTHGPGELIKSGHPSIQALIDGEFAHIKDDVLHLTRRGRNFVRARYPHLTQYEPAT